MVTAKLVRRRTKVILAAIVASWLLLAVLVLVSVGASSRASKAVKVLQDKPAAKVLPDYKAQADQVVIDYLDAADVQLPRAQGIPARLGRTVESNTSTPTPAAAIKYRSVAFLDAKHLGTVLASDQRVLDRFMVLAQHHTYVMTIVLQPTRLGPMLAALPSMAPAVQLASGGPALDWMNYTQVQLSAGAVSQVDAWAQAYAANDRTALYQLTGDPSAHTYTGLGGWQVIGTPTVVSATTRGQQALVQVQVTMAPANNTAAQTVQAFDLLMQDVSRPLPPVVAWGPAGAGWSLRPFMNAAPGAPPIPAS